MNTLLIFFALPIAVIIISAILQKVLKSPIDVAALIFAVFLVITFAFFDETFLIATLAYTILAFITAFIVKVICMFFNNNDSNNDQDDENDENENSCGNNRVMDTGTVNYTRFYGNRCNRYMRY